MKHEKLLSCQCGALLAFCLGFGAAACAATGLKLLVELPVLALGCALWAAIAAGCCYFRRGGLILGAVCLILGLLMALSGMFRQEAASMAAHAMDYYSRAYGIAVPEALLEAEASTHLWPLLAIAGAVIALCVRTVCLGKRAALTVTAAAVPLAACLVVTDTVPDATWLYLFLLGLFLLLLTQLVRRRDPAQAVRLTVLLAAPTALALLLLFILVPQNTYSEPEVDEALQSVYDWVEQRIPYVGKTADGELVVNVGGSVEDRVALNRVGTRRERETPVMEVTATYSDTLYLRARDFDTYDGKSWSATEDRKDTLSLSNAWRDSTGQVTVKTFGVHGQLYQPYYPDEILSLNGGYVKNADSRSQYTLDVARLSPNWKVVWQRMNSGGGWDLEVDSDLIYSSLSETVWAQSGGKYDAYLELPEETYQRAAVILSRDVLSGSSGDTVSVAEAIKKYVRASAEYDLDPGKMPDDAADFALWFLEESDKGYCVHFASAAVVLLRAAGIPARYVEGYTVFVTAGKTTTVREKMAHAWAEYYVEGLGWVILEATPADTDEPEETTAPTERPTEPTRATEPTEAPSETVPTGTGAATKPSQPGREEPKETPKWVGTVLAVLAVLAALTALLWGQWRLRRTRILKRQRCGSSNARALVRWRETVRLSRLLKQPPPQELRELAEKAKFSQHTVTAEELTRFTLHQQELTGSLQKRPWYLRLVYRLVFAAY